MGRTTQAAHCAHGSAPTGALPWAQRCMRVDLSPWVRRSALTGTQFNATRFYYGQPLFSRPNYYCTFMRRMFRVLCRRRIVFCVCENQIRWSLNTWHSYIMFNAKKNNFNAIRQTTIAKPAISVLNLCQICASINTRVWVKCGFWSASTSAFYML